MYNIQRRRNFIGDGQLERNDGGLSMFGIEVVQRINELGMVVDLPHASFRTAMDAIEFSQAPVAFSHDGSYTLGQQQGGGEYAAGRLIGHPTATRCYACSHAVEGSENRRFVAVLHQGPVDSPEKAVKAAIVQEHKQ